MFTDPTMKIKAFKSLIAELEEFVAHDKKADHINHINAHLYNAVLSRRAMKSANLTNTCPSFASKENIAPDQKIEPQWRFKKSLKKPGRKKSGLVLR